MQLTLTMQEWTILVWALLGALVTEPDPRRFFALPPPPAAATAAVPSSPASGAGRGGVASAMSAYYSLPWSLIVGGGWY